MDKKHLEELLKAWAGKTFSKSEKIMEKVKEEAKAQAAATGTDLLTIDKIVLGTTYDGYVKLKYNYGLFVTVQWVEWLLHKTQIDVPANLDGWKDLYNIGDKIRVKATEFKEVEGVKRVVRGQK